MKRILTLSLLSFLFLQAQAQVLFFQDFESGSIAPMTAVDVDGKPIAPNVANVAGPTWKVYNGLAVSTSWFVPAGIADDWLISTPITIAENNTFLTWEAFSPDANYRDGYEVRISTTDNQVASFTTIALTVPAENTSLTARALNLNAYVGQTIYFAFRNNSNDKFLLYVDNIRVEKYKNTDAIVRGISFEKYNPVTTQVPIKVTVENHGANPLTSLELTWTNGSDTFTDTVVGLNIPLLSTKEITHSVKLDLDHIGEYFLDVTVTNPNNTTDESPADNGGSRKVYAVSQQLPKKVLVEEGTGTWCGWCPRGAVNIDLVAEQYPDIVMPVAIHNYDPMTTAEYDGPFSSTISGYPSGHVDRKITDINPSDFGTSVLNIQNRMVPVQVKTETTYDSDTRTVVVKGTAHLSIPTQANDLRFTCVITEDHVTGTTTGYDQVNYYAGGTNGPMGGFESLPNPVPAAEMEYRFVARAILGGFDGEANSIPDALEANEDFEFEFTYVIPAGYDIDLMKAIVFVQDDETGEVLNGDISPVKSEISAVPLVPAGKFALYPNPATDKMNLTVDFQTDATVNMKIYTTNGALVKDLGALNLTSGKGSENINVADLESGMYLLELRHKNSVTALPFTKL